MSLQGRRPTQAKTQAGVPSDSCKRIAGVEDRVSSGGGWLPVDLGSAITAGFTTRDGGVSKPPWASLNLGFNTSDDPVDVAQNRALVSPQLGAPIAYATQVHGNHVLEPTPDDARAFASESPPQSVGTGDAMVVPTSANLGLGVLVADCIPVLLADPSAGIIATAHAGRKGVELNVVANVAAAMRAAGATQIRAAVGPSICGQCYEVPAELQAHVAQTAPLAVCTTRWGTPGLDLPRALLAQLEALNVELVAHLAICTFEDDDFYSYRRATLAGDGRTGRFAGIIAPVTTKSSAS